VLERKQVKYLYRFLMVCSIRLTHLVSHHSPLPLNIGLRKTRGNGRVRICRTVIAAEVLSLSLYTFTTCRAEMPALRTPIIRHNRKTNRGYECLPETVRQTVEGVQRLREHGKGEPVTVAELAREPN
jgi:hypothetical protein